MSETITSFDINVSNGPSGQTATVGSALNGKKFDGTNIGAVELTFNGLGEALTITDTELNEILSNFVVTEETKNKDAIQETKTYNLQDSLSLKLDSIALLVRGQSCSETGEAVKEGWVANWSELPVDRKRESQAALHPSYGTQPATKINNCLIIGQIYNQVSLQDDNSDPYTKVFHNGLYLPKFSQDAKGTTTGSQTGADAGLPSNHTDVDWEDSTQKFGYTIAELIEGLGLFSITVEGLDSSDDILFTESGRLSSVLSAVASKFGMYMKIDGVNDKVVFIGSDEIADSVVPDLTASADENIISASYTESNLIPTKALSYKSLIKSEELRFLRFQYGGGAGKKYVTNFEKVKWNYLAGNGSSPQGIWVDAENFFKAFFIFEAKQFWDEDKLNLYAAFLRQRQKINWRPMFRDEFVGQGFDKSTLGDPFPTNEPTLLTQTERKAIDPKRIGLLDMEVYPMSTDAGNFKTNYFNNKLTAFYRFLLEKAINGIWISRPYTQYRALRTRMEDPKLIILDAPDQDFGQAIRANTLLSEIPALVPLDNFLDAIDRGGLTIGELYQVSTENPKQWDNDSYFFMGFRHYKLQLFDVDLTTVQHAVSNEAIRYYDKNGLDLLVVIKPDFIEGVWAESVRQYNNAKTNVNVDTIKVSYSKLKSPLGEAEDEGGGAAGSVDEVVESTNRDYKKYDLLSLVGATELNPHDLVVRESSQKELEAIRADAVLNALAQKKVKSSSAEYAGLFIPDFTDITLNSFTAKFSESGTRSSVKYSTKQLLPMDEQIIKDRYEVVYNNRPVLSRDSAKRKNFLGL